MQYFPLADLQHIVLAIFLGLVFLILIYIAFGSHARRGEEKLEEERKESGLDYEAEKNPIAPLLIFVYAGVIVFAVAYLILIGIRGSPF